MHCLTVNLTGAEFQKIEQTAGKLWPRERLSRAEIMRRFALAGTMALLAMPEADRAAARRWFQETMTAEGEQKLKV